MKERDAPRFTTHKSRADWFRERTSYPQREIYPRDLAECAARPDLDPKWEFVGPWDSGGRLSSMVVDPRDPDVVWVGAAGGGVWRTGNAGRKWEQVWSDRAPTLQIGSLALDPQNPDCLYAGTGEANLTSDNYPGVGVFRLARGGTELVGDAEDRTVPIPNGMRVVPGLPRRIGALAVDPFDSNHILVGGVTHTDEERGGLFETRDGGANWEKVGNRNSKALYNTTPVLVSGNNFYCHAVVFHPEERGTIFAAVEARGADSGIWISRDNGESWDRAVNGLPRGDQFGRTSLAVGVGTRRGRTRSRVYALCGQPRNGAYLGLFRSDDLGRTWVRVDCQGLRKEGQLSYTNCIAVDPENPEVIVAGALNLYMSWNGGKNWRKVSDFAAVEGEDPRFVHADHHAVAVRGQRVYAATDAGLAVSDNGGRRWEMRTKGLAVAMFYDVDVATTNSQCLGGGMQDNGTWYTGPLSRVEQRLEGGEREARTGFRRELPGDGGWTIYDPDDETHVFASAQRTALFRRRGGPRWRRLRTGIPRSERRTVWMAILAMDSSRGAVKPRALYVGTTRVWKSVNDGDHWSAVSPDLDGTVISAIEVATADPRFVYVGTTAGGFFRSEDAGKSWSENLAGPHSPGRIITRIETMPGNARALFYTVGGVAETRYWDGKNWGGSRLARGGWPYSSQGQHGLIEFRHLYQSPDGGETWFDADAGGLPNLPHHAVIVVEGRGPWLLVAHDGGVMARRFGDAPASWRDVTGSLPNIRITDLVWQEGERWVVASTYGRGLWRISLDAIEQYSAQ